MNDIKNIVISIVITTIVVGLTELLLPQNNFKNQMRLITGTILLLSLISPFTQNYERFQFDLNEFEFSNNYNLNEKAIASSLNFEIKNILNNNDIQNGKVIIETGIENDSIIIIDVSIELNEEDKNKFNIISDEIYKKLDIKVKQE